MSLDAKQVTGASSDDQGSGINLWLRLSDEVALYILRQLPQESLKTVSLVNKKFRDLSRDDSLWTELTLDYEDIKHNAETCRKLVKRCKKLVSLKISAKSKNCWDPLNVSLCLKIMTVVIRAQESLRSLEVDKNMRMRSPAVMAKLGRLKNLTSLNFTVVIIRLLNEGTKMLKELAKLKELEELNLRIMGDSNNRSIPVLESVIKNLNKLKKVEISLPHMSQVTKDLLVKRWRVDYPNLHIRIK